MARLVNFDADDIVNKYVLDQVTEALNKPIQELDDGGESCAFVCRLYNEWQYGEVINLAIKRFNMFESGTEVETIDNHYAIFFFKNSLALLDFLSELSTIADRTLHATDILTDADVYLNSSVRQDVEIQLDNLGVTVVRI